jgi:hypothetical protein
MSYNKNMATITVGDTTYDVETHSTNLGQRYTISLDGEDVFEGLEGRCENEEYIESHDNPRDASNVGTMAISYRGYDLGGPDDEDISQIEFEIECDRCGGHGERPFLITEGPEGALREVVVDCAKCKGEGVVPINPVDYFKRERGARVVVGLTVYEHSGITMRAGNVTLPWDSDRWDTSFVGFIFDTPEQLKQTMGDDVTDEKIEEALKQEVSLYASYLEGDVCWFNVEDDETGYNESCGGFVGCHEECESECYNALESAIVKRLAEVDERAHWAARDTVTI